MTTADRRDRERQQRQNDILDAAEAVFAAKGVRNATIDDVAERAEVSKGTIYLYFKSKEMLYMGMGLRASRILMERFTRAAASETVGLAKVTAIGRSYYDFCFEYPNYFKAMLYIDNFDAATHAAIQDEPMAREAHAVGQASLKVLSDCIEIGIEDGSISRDVNPAEMAVMLWAQSNGVIQMLKNSKEHFKLHGQEIGSLFDDFLVYMERGLTPQPN